ncbi:MAG: aminoglycoside phosphotransferase, partial [alpha proteobacterium MED-G10]
NISDQDYYLFCYDILGIQRHLKVLGIFCRLSKRDKKDIYLLHLPRVKKMLLSTLKKNQFKDLYLILKDLIV